MPKPVGAQDSWEPHPSQLRAEENLLVGGFARGVHAPMTQLLPVARTRLSSHQRGLQRRKQEALKISKEAPLARSSLEILTRRAESQCRDKAHGAEAGSGAEQVACHPQGPHGPTLHIQRAHTRTGASGSSRKAGRLAPAALLCAWGARP